MKVLVVVNKVESLFRTRKEVVTALLDAGCDVVVSAPDDCSIYENTYRCSFVRNSISRFGTNPFAELKTILALRKQIRQINPDVVITFTIKPNLYALIAASSRTPVIPNVTGLSAFLFRKGFLPRIVSGLQRRLFRKAAIVFCQNKSTYNAFSELDLNNLDLLPGSGVNLDEIRFVEYPLPKDKIECVLVARVQKDKGYYEFIEASQKLSAYHFTVVGASEDDQIVDRIKGLENVNYLGQLPHDETLKKIAESHVLILPSYHEGMANVILEAHALGRPVLTTDVAGCIDAIEDGRTGFSFAPKSADAIVEACNRFASLSWDEWKQMGIEGRSFVEKNFDRRIVVGEYMKAIREAVEK